MTNQILIPAVLNAVSTILVIIVLFALAEIRKHTKDIVAFVKAEEAKHLTTKEQGILNSLANEALTVVKGLYPGLNADDLTKMLTSHLQILATQKGLHIDFDQVTNVVNALVAADQKPAA